MKAKKHSDAREQLRREVKEPIVDRALRKAFEAMAALGKRHDLTVRVGAVPNGWAGAYCDNQRRIIISEEASPMDRIWTLAHEYGHAFRHAGRLDFAAYRRDSTYRTEAEAEADRFAHLLLVIIAANGRRRVKRDESAGDRQERLPGNRD